MPDYGGRNLLAKEFGVGRASVTRYLRGQYRPNNERMELIKKIRARARELVGGKKVYVARDDDGSLHYFPYEPRKEYGQWVNKIDPYNRPEFPEFLLPPTAKPKASDEHAIVIKITRDINRT